MKKILALLLVMTASVSAFVTTNTYTVPGDSDLWLAGMPDGSTASVGDVAPAQSPVLAAGLSLSGVSFLTFAASGGVSNTGQCPSLNCHGPEGGPVTNHFATLAENGISDLFAPVNSLIGVFLDNSQPDSTPAPATLDFSTALSRDFTTLSPLLKQAFFIGDGLTSGAVLQQFNVPLGATRLYLGTMDGFGWFNNNGAFIVDVTPVTVEDAERNCVGQTVSAYAKEYGGIKHAVAPRGFSSVQELLDSIKAGCRR